ncbi:MAG TPA: DUF2277 domain-containing protein [Thermomicrobiaceae bacterium]|nr:DUF2277 domain-containing protein [Thermomicrobiaceae bacterium]
MCRSIRTLYHLDPPVTDEEVRAAALQFVRKLSGFTRPSRANEAAFAAAVDEIGAAADRLLATLQTPAPPRDREEVAARARARARTRDRDRDARSATTPGSTPSTGVVDPARRR